ncbi:MAG: selenide, water dikinase SelD [Gemmataceae bacterium]
METADPIQKNVVLVGAGNAHLRFVRMFGMKPVPGVAVTLVSEAPVIPYSAMVPGHVAGDYPWEQVTIDLVRLCAAMKVRFVAGWATALDTRERKVELQGRPALSYDAVSLGLGSLPARPMNCKPRERSWPMRPLAGLIGQLDRLERELKEKPRPVHIAVVGGGASGCELALAIRKRLGRFTDVRVTLVQGAKRLLPRFPERAASLFEGVLKERGVTIRVGTRVTAADEESIELDSHEQLPCDAVLWATNAAPPELFADSGLKLNDDGFLLVRDTLQSIGDPSVFGTGDCISMDAYPDLLKNGVYAVRQGGVLFKNVLRHLKEQSLGRFRPQKRCLCLMNLSDGTAALVYGPLVWRSRWIRRLKDRIDRVWIDKFTRFPKMKGADGAAGETQMRCGGCGSKISSDVLSAVLKRIDPGEDPRVLLGSQAGEDASVHRARPELFGDQPQHLVEVQTVDYFKAFVDDPFLFGRIAALNAVSDLYAMNARPFAAMALATLPQARGPVQEAMLYELLSGATDSLRKLGVVLTGGHTTEGSELALGFAVTGYAEEHKLFRKGSLEVGDQLILTRPLGTGALLAAWMRGECRADWFTPLIESMLVANDRAAQIFAKHEVTACTDVTGFGLAGHLLEMLDGSNMNARLDSASVPIYEGFKEVTENGIVSSLHADNVRSACRVTGSYPDWLFDPQTSGGLLAGVKREQVAEVLRELIEAGYPRASNIGTVTRLPAGEKPIIELVRA